MYASMVCMCVCWDQPLFVAQDLCPVLLEGQCSRIPVSFWHLAYVRLFLRLPNDSIAGQGELPHRHPVSAGKWGGPLGGGMCDGDAEQGDLLGS